MSLDSRQFGVKFECEQQTTVLLRSDSRKNPLSLRINIRSNKEPNSDLLYLQIFNKSSNIIFHAFLRPSQCRMMICPDDVMGKPETTIIVYSTETVRSYIHVWHRIIMAGKTTVTLKGEATANYTAVSLHPLKNYQDFCVDATNKIPYHIDVVSTSPQGYMLTDYHYSGGPDGLIVLLHQVYPPESFLVMFRYQPYPTYNLPFVLKPATEYKLQLFRVYTRRGKEDIGIGNSHSTVTTFTTYMTQAEVRELYMKALAYLSDHRPCFTIITHFYRNKSDEYFTNIMTSNGVMYKYDKNWGGEQASSLNKQIKGLFFNANVDPVTMTPPDISYFGPVRLHIPTYLLLHDDINMYFSDFYCHTVK